METKVIIGYGGNVHTLEGFACGEIICINKSDNKRKWWQETQLGFKFVCKGGDILTFSPVDKEEFFDKYIKNLEDSVESPFNYTAEEVK